MWSSEPQIIELIKGERGLGFSILDYQVRDNFKLSNRMTNLISPFLVEQKTRIHWMQMTH